MPRVFVHIVTHNHQDSIATCLTSVLASEGFTLWDDLIILVTDNASSDKTVSTIENAFPNQIRLQKNHENLGFSRAHNEALARAIHHHVDYIFILNPDLKLHPQCLSTLVSALENDPSAGTACPKLLRADAHLNPVTPREFDATGMYITRAFRHFDRGSGILDQGQYDHDEYVFGGSGAALLVRTEFVHDVSPPLNNRLELFDEHFFAYREDADLAWRAQRLGWRCRYVAGAIGYHRRHVLPSRRSRLAANINRFGVRNRFLLQMKHFSPLAYAHCIPSMLLRNLIVLSAVLLKERSSIRGVLEALSLWGEFRKKRDWLNQHARVSNFDLQHWFTPGVPALASSAPVAQTCAPLTQVDHGSGTAGSTRRKFTLGIIQLSTISHPGSAMVVPTIVRGVADELQLPGLDLHSILVSTNPNRTTGVAPGYDRVLVLSPNLPFGTQVTEALSYLPSCDVYLLSENDEAVSLARIRELFACYCRHPTAGIIAGELRGLHFINQAQRITTMLNRQGRTPAWWQDFLLAAAPEPFFGATQKKPQKREVLTPCRVENCCAEVALLAGEVISAAKNDFSKMPSRELFFLYASAYAKRLNRPVLALDLGKKKKLPHPPTATIPLSLWWSNVWRLLELRHGANLSFAIRVAVSSHLFFRDLASWLGAPLSQQTSRAPFVSLLAQSLRGPSAGLRITSAAESTTIHTAESLAPTAPESNPQQPDKTS